MSEDQLRVRLAEVERPKAHLRQVPRGGLADRVWRSPEVQRALPLSIALRLARMRAGLAWRLSRRYRGAMLMHATALAGPGASREEVRRLAREHLAEQCLRGCFTLHPDTHIPVRGIEHLERARAAGRGVIVATFHMGLWRNLKFALAAHGYRLYVSGLAGPPRPGPQGRSWIANEAWAEEVGCRWVTLGGSYAVFRALLERGEVCKIEWDIPGRRPVPVEVLGRTLRISGGVARLALETGAFVVPGFAWREPDGPVAVLFPAINPREVEGESELNARIASAFESALAPRLAQAHYPPWGGLCLAEFERVTGISSRRPSPGVPPPPRPGAG
ncbi:MAG: lysophospholipid acyltransferase family protein [Solirubrobacteraceae bacterium]